LITSELLYP